MHEDRWYFQREDQLVGPFRLAELKRLAKVGMIVAQTPLIAANGQRLAAKALFARKSAAPAPPPEKPVDLPATPHDSAPAPVVLMETGITACPQCSQKLAIAAVKRTRGVACPFCGTLIPGR